MTVCLDEAVTIAETTYKTLVETYNEIREIAENLRILSNNHWYTTVRSRYLNYECDDQDETLESVEAEDTIAYQDRRKRRGRASRYNDVITILR